MPRHPPTSTLFPYTTLFRSLDGVDLLLHLADEAVGGSGVAAVGDRKSTRLNSSHLGISYAVFCLKKKKSGAGIVGQRRTRRIVEMIARAASSPSWIRERTSR